MLRIYDILHACSDHWTLTLVDPDKQTAYFMDPLKRRLPTGDWMSIVETWVTGLYIDHTCLNFIKSVEYSTCCFLSYMAEVLIILLFWCSAMRMYNAEKKKQGRSSVQWKNLAVRFTTSDFQKTIFHFVRFHFLSHLIVFRAFLPNLATRSVDTLSCDTWEISLRIKTCHCFLWRYRHIYSYKYSN